MGINQLIIDYVNELETYNGMIDGAKAGINMEVEQAISRTYRIAHENGKVIFADLNRTAEQDNPIRVYIVSGDYTQQGGSVVIIGGRGRGNSRADRSRAADGP